LIDLAVPFQILGGALAFQFFRDPSPGFGVESRRFVRREPRSAKIFSPTGVTCQEELSALILSLSLMISYDGLQAQET
jgi:hypothetical protein